MPGLFRPGLFVSLFATVLIGGCGPNTASTTSGAASPKPTPCVDGSPPPTQSMTDAQRNQFYQQNTDQYHACYAAWLANLDLSKLDLGKLPRVPISASYSAPDATLDVARTRAETIVSGVVTSINPLPGEATDVTVSVDRTLKGSANSSVVVRQGSHLAVGPDWQTPLIADSEAGPLLIPGDQVVLLLVSSSDGSVGPEGFTGIYYVKNGQMGSLVHNPFAAQVNGVSQSAFESAVANGTPLPTPTPATASAAP